MTHDGLIQAISARIDDARESLAQQIAVLHDDLRQHIEKDEAWQASIGHTVVELQVRLKTYGSAIRWLGGIIGAAIASAIGWFFSSR